MTKLDSFWNFFWLDVANFDKTKIGAFGKVY